MNDTHSMLHLPQTQSVLCSQGGSEEGNDDANAAFFFLIEAGGEMRGIRRR